MRIYSIYHFFYCLILKIHVLYFNAEIHLTNTQCIVSKNNDGIVIQVRKFNTDTFMLIIFHFHSPVDLYSLTESIT